MSRVAPEWEAAPRARIDREFANSLVGAEHADAVALDCALVRSVLWALTRDGQSPHILRIMNLLVDVARSRVDVDEQALRTRLRAAMNQLADIGDILELSEGRWHPASVRAVDLGTPSAERLLIGGVPSSVLPAELRGLIAHDGPFRRVSGDQLRETLALPIEPRDSWVGAPRQPLLEWARAILEATLSPYADPKESNGVRVYSPREARRGAAQLRRWVERSDLMTGRFLVDRSRVFGAREYRVVQMRGGRIERSGAVLLPGEPRRFMYGLDALADNPVEAECERLADTLTVTLWSELPRAEQRLFAALGTLEVPLDNYYPRTWRFRSAGCDVALGCLRVLNLRLVSRKSRGGTS